LSNHSGHNPGIGAGDQQELRVLSVFEIFKSMLVRGKNLALEFGYTFYQAVHIKSSRNNSTLSMVAGATRRREIASHGIPSTASV
jgi:hypothetical protein